MYIYFGNITNCFYYYSLSDPDSIGWNPTGCRGKRDKFSVTENERISLSVGHLGAKRNDASGRLERKISKGIKGEEISIGSAEEIGLASDWSSGSQHLDRIFGWKITLLH